MRRVLPILGFGLFACGVLFAGADKEDPIKGYRGWTRVTKEPVSMARFVAMLCRSAPELTSSKNPHVPKQFLVYFNHTASRALRTKAAYPEGSVIVKEKFDAQDKLALDRLPEPELLTVMVKGKKGSNPATDDWLFYAADGEGKRLKGSVSHCVKCHEPVAGWVFGGYGSVPESRLRPGKRFPKQF